jgi:hypothetical protein
MPLGPERMVADPAATAPPLGSDWAKLDADDNSIMVKVSSGVRLAAAAFFIAAARY